MKGTKVQPSAHCACAVLQIAGLGYDYTVTRALPLVVRGESHMAHGLPIH